MSNYILLEENEVKEKEKNIISEKDIKVKLIDKIINVEYKYDSVRYFFHSYVFTDVYFPYNSSYDTIQMCQLAYKLFNNITFSISFGFNKITGFKYNPLDSSFIHMYTINNTLMHYMSVNISSSDRLKLSGLFKKMAELNPKKYKKYIERLKTTGSIKIPNKKCIIC
jgi:hypothetical protein